jgi:hypothetical protein
MTKNTKKIILIIGLIVIGLFGFYKLAYLFSPGSYSYAEIYELNYPEEKVIEAIRQFKIGHSEMVVPKVTIQNSGTYDLSESEGRKDSSHWYLIYFYYPKENQIILTWTRPSENWKTDFAFVSLNNGLDIGHWKNINNDFSISENRNLKKEFEERILNPVKRLLINDK